MGTAGKLYCSWLHPKEVARIHMGACMSRDTASQMLIFQHHQTPMSHLWQESCRGLLDLRYAMKTSSQEDLFGKRLISGVVFCLNCLVKPWNPGLTLECVWEHQECLKLTFLLAKKYTDL